MSEYIHIVCLEAPSPPDYGGAIDMYYKIIALAKTGKKIILHYFSYRNNRGIHGLEAFCSEVHAYERKGIRSLSLKKPFIVSSRINKALVTRLNQDDYPVILEGLHCSGLAFYLEDQSRAIVRMHNEESEYYKRLAASEENLKRKAYFKMESKLVKKYYKSLSRLNLKYACLSLYDMEVMKNEFHLKDLHFIPCFIPWKENISLEGKGDYCLYHGNMKVSENESAALWLIDVFSKLNIVLVIAGAGISKHLRNTARKSRNVKLISDPAMEELNALVRDAHIHVLPSMNATGVKLKLLHAVFEGRFCLTNTNGVRGSAIENLVHIADTPAEFRKMIKELYEKPFTEEDKKNRLQLLAVYDNIKNAEKINALC